MYIARTFVLMFLILAIVLGFSPAVQGELSQAWESARPGVLNLMDGMYALVRGFVAGADSHIDDDAPGVDFDMITTEEGRIFS